MNRKFTLVEIAFYPEYLNNWLRFGVPDLDYDLDRRRALACFKPGRIFGYVRWFSNEYGTQKWQFYVVRTVGASQPLTRIDGVHPGGEILLETAGNVKVKQVLSMIDGFEDRDFDPGEVSAAYYRHVHNGTAVRQPIHPYTNAQHAAVQAAQMGVVMKMFWLSGTALSVLALMFPAVVQMPVKLVYNGSESAPLGFYWIDHQAVNRHDYVLVQVPKHVRDLVVSRKYLSPDVPLIKSVAGVAGDTVCRHGLQVLINRVTVAVARSFDKKGRALPNWQGCHVLTADDVFLLQDHHLSFDGRYFGPVKRSMIIGRAAKLQSPW